MTGWLTSTRNETKSQQRNKAPKHNLEPSLDYLLSIHNPIYKITKQEINLSFTETKQVDM